VSSVRIAAVQMDSPAGQKQRNLDAVARLAQLASEQGAKIVLFHEGLLVDYVEVPEKEAEPVPRGPSTARLVEIAREADIWLGVGMAEQDNGRLYITQVFCGPEGYVTKYRKTWLWLAHKGTVDAEIRDEHKFYNPGTGPHGFELGGVRSTCLICADGNSERAWRQVMETQPQVVFWPNNRHSFRPAWLDVVDRARRLGRPIVATNRIGVSGSGTCDGGAIIVDGEGRILAHCLKPGEEEIVVADVPLLD